MRIKFGILGARRIAKYIAIHIKKGFLHLLMESVTFDEGLNALIFTNAAYESFNSRKVLNINYE